MISFKLDCLLWGLACTHARTHNSTLRLSTLPDPDVRGQPQYIVMLFTIDKWLCEGMRSYANACGRPSSLHPCLHALIKRCGTRCPLWKRQRGNPAAMKQEEDDCVCVCVKGGGVGNVVWHFSGLLFLMVLRSRWDYPACTLCHGR